MALVSALLATLLVLPFGVAALALWWAGAGDPDARARSRGRDAVWLGHAWVDGRKGPADLAGLPQLVRGGVRDLYVHAGPLEHDGSLRADRYPAAAQLVAAVHRELPGVRVQAWLGDLVAPESPEGLHLDDPVVRGRIVDSARQVLDAGFDGVHYDLEPVHSGSAGFLQLLDATRAVTSARSAPLSAAAPQIDPPPPFGRWYPHPAPHSVAALTGHPKWWSQQYFGEVARRVDQIAVMSYDTGMPLPSLYRGYVAQQTGLALQAVPESVDLLMGLPAYWADEWGHRGSAETVPAAVAGVRKGLSDRAPDRQNIGVALYADFSATDRDWAAYRRDWCLLAS
ncbi:hypothetical protein ACFYNO_00570 [Kitasatospora sp. NPDC006697]|uniref:hypothetical protein n=1 Tax=Kitasatospora sp. NPDC006697 TaxID=3364020 RepID=UPI00367F3CE5